MSRFSTITTIFYLILQPNCRAAPRSINSLKRYTVSCSTKPQMAATARKPRVATPRASSPNSGKITQTTFSHSLLIPFSLMKKIILAVFALAVSLTAFGQKNPLKRAENELNKGDLAAAKASIEEAMNNEKNQKRSRLMAGTRQYLQSHDE